MVFPYETEAANGEPMPDGLSLVDQCAFYFLQTMYRGLRTGSKDRDQAIKEKGQMTYQYKNALWKVGGRWAISGQRHTDRLKPPKLLTEKTVH